jgi:hypothetical protein
MKAGKGLSRREAIFSGYIIGVVVISVFVMVDGLGCILEGEAINSDTTYMCRGSLGGLFCGAQ